MMRRVWLTIRLLEPVVLGARPTTVGAYRTLDFVPGAALLGVVAARLYDRLSHGDAWTVFHSGQVRFLDAHPLTPDGRPTFPIPRLWGTSKNAPVPASGGRLDPERVHRLGAPAAPSRILRGGYVALDGTFVRPHRRLVLKTAIDRSRGRARETALFGYETLMPVVRDDGTPRAGFLGGIEADGDVDEDLFARVIEAAVGPVRIGRSRSAEFGGAIVERVELSGVDGLDRFPARPPAPDRLRLWLLSDLVVEPEILTRCPELRLGDLTGEDGDTFPLVPGESAIAFERIGGFNAHLGASEWTRVGFARGSVLTFEVPAELDRAPLYRRLQAGLGAAREIGCGQAWPDPPLLAHDRPAFVPAAGVDIEERPAEDGRDGPLPPLVGWLQARAERRGLAVVAVTPEDLKWIHGLYRRARALQGAVPGDPVGPTKSQWGRMHELARRVELTGADLLAGFDDLVAERAGQRTWSLPVETDGTCFANALRSKLEERRRDEGELRAARWLGALAARLRPLCEAWRRGEDAA